MKKTTIFILAHADDEMGALPLIRRLKKTSQMYFFYLTNNCTNNDTELTGKRNSETRHFLDFLGIKSDHIFFIGENLNIDDGNLHFHLRTSFNILSTQIQKLRLENSKVTVISPAWEGGHHDHDSCFVLARKLSSDLHAHFFQFSLYNAYKTIPPFFRTNSPVPHSRTFYIRSTIYDLLCLLRGFASFPSQIRTWIGLSPFFLCHYLQFRLKLQTSRFESLFRPHKGPLLYETRFGKNWEDLSGIYKKFVTNDD